MRDLAALRLSTVRSALLTTLAAVLTVILAASAGALTDPGRAQATPSVGDLDTQITDASRRLEILVEEYNATREDLRATAAQSRRLGRELLPQTIELRQRQIRIGGLVAATYQQTRSAPTIALLASRTPRQFVDQLLVLNQIAADQRRALAELHHARERVAATQRALGTLAAQQRRQQIRLAVKRATVEGEIAALRTLRQAAYGGSSRYHEAITVPPPYVPGAAGRVVAFAFRQLGKPYRWGAGGPQAYDCSGLTSAAWAQVGVQLPHNARRQYAVVAHISRADLRPGDLIFFYGGISHVGIYIGDGKMIHAPEFGEDVRIARYDSQPIHGFGRPR